MSECRTCGTKSIEGLNPEHCGNCPPWTCEECGQPSHTDALCGCWTPIDDMPLADLKALFAASDLSLERE